MQSLFLHVGLLVQRILLGGMMFAFHGAGKLENLFAGKWWEGPGILGLGGPVEFFLVTMAEGVCSLLVLFGIGTRFFAIPVVIAMLVAGAVAHGNDPLPADHMRGLNAVEHLNDEGREVIASQASDNPLAAKIHDGVQRAHNAQTDDERASAIQQTQLSVVTGSGEMAFLFLAGFLGLALMGGGRFSLDWVVWPAVRSFVRRSKDKNAKK